MNILILGGLMLIGLAAIIGVVLLIMNEPRTKATAPIRAVEARPGKATTPLAETAPTHAVEAHSDQGSVSQVDGMETVTSLKQNYPALREATPPSDAQQFARMNGQFHELAISLRALHEQSSELEERLGKLADVFERIEESPQYRVNIKEEDPSSQDDTTL